MAPELLVSDTVDEWTEQTRKHVGEQEGGEEDLGAVWRPGGDEDDRDEGREEGQHADEELDSMQQDGVAGVSGRLLVRARNGLGSAQDLQVGDDQGQANEGKQKNLKTWRQSIKVKTTEWKQSTLYPAKEQTTLCSIVSHFIHYDLASSHVGYKYIRFLEFLDKVWIFHLNDHTLSPVVCWVVQIRRVTDGGPWEDRERLGGEDNDDVSEAGDDGDTPY